MSKGQLSFSGPVVNRKLPFFNRELSWLTHNRRVLETVADRSCPLPERLRALVLHARQLDQFFEIRVAGLLQKKESGKKDPSADGLTPVQQLRRIHDVVNSQVRDASIYWEKILKGDLEKAGILFRRVDTLNKREAAWARETFHRNVLPVVTPMAVDPTHPFPQLANKALNLLVALTDPGGRGDRMAVVPVPSILSPLLVLPAFEKNDARQSQVIFLSDLIRAHCQDLFPGYPIRGAYAFRITRNSELYIDEEEVDNLLATVEEELSNRRRGAAVRVEAESDIPVPTLQWLAGMIQVSRDFAYRQPAVLSYGSLDELFHVDREVARHLARLESTFVPAFPKRLSIPGQIFGELREKDVLLYHPYDSYRPVLDFIEQAALDPAVISIKISLYRTPPGSPVLEYLRRASLNGKQVTVLLELKARFAEARNIRWARQLEDAGVYVVYGLPGVKVHFKGCLVVRQEERGSWRYAHLATGDYQDGAGNRQADFSLLTAHPEITREMGDLFNHLTGYCRTPSFQWLHVSPFNLHGRALAMIDREIKAALQGLSAKIVVKVNSLLDEAILQKLYMASRAGVAIDLLVRESCALVPGVPGLSENIRVIAPSGPFEENSRFFYFENGVQGPDILLGSADWMPRNFFRRVDLVVPVVDPDIRQRFLNDIIPAYFHAGNRSYQLGNDGGYRSLGNEEPPSFQELEMRREGSSRRVIPAARMEPPGQGV